MFPARLLIPIVVTCSLFATGQTQRPRQFLTSSQSSESNAASHAPFANFATGSEPWRIVPKEPASSTDSLGRMLQAPGVRYQGDHDSQMTVLREPGTDNIAISLEGSASDATCYAIRSYVVARDSKDSESTHPVRYSTCQAASRYRLRKTVVNQSTGR